MLLQEPNFERMLFDGIFLIVHRISTFIKILIQIPNLTIEHGYFLVIGFHCESAHVHILFKQSDLDGSIVRQSLHLRRSSQQILVIQVQLNYLSVEFLLLQAMLVD